MSLPVIDCHQHLWDTEAHLYPYLRDGSRERMHGAPLPRRYLIEDYLADTRDQGLIASVHVQCGWDPSDPVGETRWLTAIAARHGYPHALVAFADLTREDVADTLDDHLECGNVRGIRQHVGWHDEPLYRLAPRPDFLTDRSWLRGFEALARRNLSFDLQIYPHQAEDALGVVRRFPETTFIIGSAGMPLERSAAGLARWRDALAALASAPNTVIKIAGLGMSDHHWTTDSIRPLVKDILGIFGAERAMFASNFPVDGLFGSFARLYDAFRAIVADEPVETRRRLFCENAAHVYRLAVAPAQP